MFVQYIQQRPMTTKLKRLISAIILIVFITVSSFVLPQNVNEFIQKRDTIASEIEVSTKSSDNNENENLEEKEDSKNFTMLSLNIVYHLFYKYLHNKDFNN